MNPPARKSVAFQNSMISPKGWLCAFCPGAFKWPLVLVSLLCGCVTRTDETPPPSSTLPRSEALGIARNLARQEPGRQSGPGGGDSMAPLFGPNTILLINPIAFADLERGMLVAYRSREGRRIVHRLERQDGDRWLALGLNNRYLDEEPVTPDNLIGIVYGVFNAEASPTSPPSANQLASP